MERPPFEWPSRGFTGYAEVQTSHMGLSERADLNRDVRLLRSLWETAERRDARLHAQAAIAVLRERLAQLRALDAANDVLQG